MKTAGICYQEEGKIRRLIWVQQLVHLRSDVAVVAAGDMRKFYTKALILKHEQKVVVVRTISCFLEHLLHQTYADPSSLYTLHLDPSQQQMNLKRIVHNMRHKH